MFESELYSAMQVPPVISFSPEQLMSFLLGPFGTLVITIIIIYSGYKRYWVWGWYAKELKDTNIKLEHRLDAIRGEVRTVTSIADKTAKIAEYREVTSE